MTNKIGTTDIGNTIEELLVELEHCTETERKQKILIINGILKEMKKEDFKSIFSKKLFNRINSMIEERKTQLKNAIYLLKQIGYYRVLSRMWNNSFDLSLLKERIQKMIAKEGKKKEMMDDKFMVDLCECYIAHSYDFPPELHSICIPCLLKVALNKDGSEETQKEVEMALLHLSCFKYWKKIPEKFYLNEIKEIIQYHQKHQHLTQLAYRFAWKFLTDRLFWNGNLEDVIANELLFVREAAKELEELTRSVNWKRKEEEKVKEVNNVEMWLSVIDRYLISISSWDEEHSGLIFIIVSVFRAAKEKYKEISKYCIFLLGNAAGNMAMDDDALLKGGAIDITLEAIVQLDSIDNLFYECLSFFDYICEKIKMKTKNELEEAKRKETKRKLLEKMEEEGYEDIFTSFHTISKDYVNIYDI
ncbi:uncharacterized protein MONOS_18542 [Monocercomonoides exilis]|uniref:uncharacterized protein n=1 Tax=Monocercomonoides exilis TaxID=2049356 RepID=UPI00355A446C|nr:hypothetical protein MONOS_18542 [Monocercomonoides exilis]